MSMRILKINAFKAPLQPFHMLPTCLVIFLLCLFIAFLEQNFRTKGLTTQEKDNL